MNVAKLLPKFRRLESVLRAYEERESWTRSDLRSYQLERLNQLWQIARTETTHYQELTQIHELPEQFESIEEFVKLVPTLSKETVRSQPERLLSRNPRPGRWHRTGGSTGVPTKVYWEHAAHLEMLRAKYRSEQAHGLDVFDKKVFFWGHSGSFAPGLSGRIQRVVQPVQDRLRNRLRVSAYQLGVEELKSHLERMRVFAPRSLYGYSSAVELLASSSRQTGIDLPTLDVAILTAEPAEQAMLNRVSEQLECRAVIEYGAVECGLIAYMMPDQTIRLREDVAIVEAIPVPGAEPMAFQIVVTVLGNPSFPLLRYQIGDTTSEPILATDQGFGVLTDIQGRSNDILLSKSGHRVHSMAVKHAVEQWPQIRRFSAHQDDRGKMTLTIEAAERLTEANKSVLKGNVEVLLAGYPVEIDFVDRIPGNLAGKHRWIMSDLVPAHTTDEPASQVDPSI